MVQEEDKNDVQAEAARKKMKSSVMGEAVLKAVTKQAPKNPRKNNKKTDDTETVSEPMETTSSSAVETGEFRVIFHVGLALFITTTFDSLFFYR